MPKDAAPSPAPTRRPVASGEVHDVHRAFIVLPPVLLAAPLLALAFETFLAWLGFAVGGGLTLLLFLFAPLGALLVSWAKRPPRVRRGLLEVDASGVFLDGRLFVERRQILEAAVITDQDRLKVRLTRGRFHAPLSLPVADEAEGYAVLEALGFGGETARVSFAAADGHTGVQVVASLAVILAIWTVARSIGDGGGALFDLALALAVLGIPTMLLLARRRVTVGTDGVALHHGGRQRRFIPHGRITSFTIEGTTLRLVVDGETLWLPIRGVRSDDDTSAARAYREAALVRRLSELRRLGVGGGGSSAHLAVEPAGLNDAGSREGGAYRLASLPRDAVWAIVEDPAAPRQARVRAANALRLPPDETPRFRVAIAATAEPELREELEEVLELRTLPSARGAVE